MIRDVFFGLKFSVFVFRLFFGESVIEYEMRVGLITERENRD